MAYNPIDGMNKIYGLKQSWHSADDELQKKKNKTVGYINNWLGRNMEGNYTVDMSGAVPDSEIKALQERKDNAASKARSIYNDLRGNGYTDYRHNIKPRQFWH